MKTRTVFLVLLILCSISNTLMGTTVTINQVFTSDTVFSIDTYYSGKCSKLELNANIVMNSDTSMVRIFMTDSKGNRWMISEVYPLISSSSSVSLSRVCEETKYLCYNTNPVNIEIYITDASIDITTIVFTNKMVLLYKTMAQEHKIDVEKAKVAKINENLEDKDLLWRASLSEIVLTSYNTIASVSGGYKGNIDGYYYYDGGYYCSYTHYDDFVSNTKIYRSVDTLPSVQTHSFDWRTAHDAQLLQSPYFDGDPDYTTYWASGGIFDTIYEYGNGWLTGVKNAHHTGDCPNGCYIFAVTTALEPVLNLYFNQHLDYDLSEQHLMDCAYEYDPTIGTCYTGGYSLKVQQFINNGYTFVDESSHPWLDSMLYICDDVTPVECKISGVTSSSISSDENTTKRAIIEYGPLAAHPIEGHIAGIVGFKMIQSNDTLRLNRGWSMIIGEETVTDRLIVPLGHPLIGRTAWIFKENNGPHFGDRGYIMIIGQQGELPTGYSSYCYTTPLVDSLNLSLTPEFHDYDGDGYYFWGLGPKPANCPGPNLEDCDDNDPFRLYYDENLFCTYDCDSIQEMVSSNPIYINSDTTIYGCILTRPIVVAGNVLLTLRGEFQCTENVFIMANIGSTIYAVGATFNATCSDNWGGFIGFANMDPSLLGGNTGRSMILLRNCIIEDATQGIVGDATAILRAYNTTFKNNIIDIRIEPWYLSSYYSQVNQNSTSEFINCNFITPSSMHNDSCLENVRLSYCKDVEFNNCAFSDNGIGGMYFHYNNRSALTTYKAGYKIESCDFDNVGTCIRSVNSGYLPVDIYKNTAINSHYGFYLSGVHGAYIVDNHLQYWKNNDDPSVPEVLPYAIYVDNCHDFQFEHNTMRKYSSISDTIIGIIANDTYNSNEIIYRNIVGKLFVGVEAIGLNKDAIDPYNGLQISCNYLNGLITDIFVTNNLTDPYPPGYPVGIAGYQGNLQQPAGNRFGLPDYAGRINIAYSVTTGLTYFHPSSSLYPVLYPDSVINVTRVESEGIFIDSINCPDYTDTDGNDTIIIIPELRLLKTEINEIKNTLTSLTDGGNTELMIAEIILATDNTAWQTYLSLMDKSPYLSDESLKEIAKKEEALTSPMVRDILVANPQAAKDPEIAVLLDERIDVLPQYMIDQINAGVTEISPKEYLEIQKSTLETVYSRKSSALLREFTRNPELFSESDIIDLFGIKDGYIGMIKLAEFYSTTSNYTGAISVLTNINTNDPEIADEIENMSDLFETLQNVESDTLIMSTENINALLDIAARGGWAGAYAKGLLSWQKQAYYPEPVFLPEFYNLRKIVSTQNVSRENYFDIYPNPATKFINISYKLPEDSKYITLKIVNSLGKNEMNISLKNTEDIILIDIENLVSGYFIIILQADNKNYGTINFTVVK